MMSSPIDRNDGANVEAYQILRISFLALSLLAATVFYVKRSDNNMHPVVVHADRVPSKKFATHHVFKEKYFSQNWPTKVTVTESLVPHK
uniref:Transmembrane protein n=1 Tax=Solanum lycopersicum TaxID=4081 RepID=A0A3Q7HBH1_SOLLC